MYAYCFPQKFHEYEPRIGSKRRYNILVMNVRPFLTFWLSKIILNKCSPTEKLSFRNLEKLSSKLVNVEQHRNFNVQCIQHGLSPKYTNIRLHNADAGTQPFVHRFREDLVKYEVERQESEIQNLKLQLEDHRAGFKSLVNSDIRYGAFIDFLKRNLEKNKAKLIIQHTKKMCNIYGGEVPPTQECSRVVNLTDIPIDGEIEKVMQLGMNCHLKGKVSKLTRMIEIEKLYDSLMNKVKSNEVFVEDSEQLRTELKAIGLKQQDDHNKDILTKAQYATIKEFKNNPDIVIRKADKSNTFVLMRKVDYCKKIDAILSDRTKFQKITKDPTEDLKKQINSSIAVINAEASPDNFMKLEGHYEPGYIYGNPKIHKNLNDPPLRPIISQIGTVVYETAKKLNSIIAKYMPKQHVIDSTYEFIEICKTIKNPKFFASLDVESLFTNVPVSETIEIILNHVYENPNIPPPHIPKLIMKKLLNTCTTKSPFRNSDGALFVQTDGVSMGSPLGPTFASYYMCELENRALQTVQNRPKVYCRYVDDCFLAIESFDQLVTLKNYFEENSVLHFTYEMEVNKRLPFLDVLLNRSPNGVDTNVFRKTTNSEECINYKSICPAKYKLAVIKTLLHRAYAVCSSWENFHSEVDRIRQLLVNNSFPISVIDSTIQKFVNQKFDPNEAPRKQQIVLYYRNQYTSQAKMDENALATIINRNVFPVDQSKDIALRIFYKNPKLKYIFIKNNSSKSSANSHVVYQYTCPEDGCNTVSYIGYTTCSLAKRFYTHVQSGSIHLHNKSSHSSKPLTRELLKSTKVLYRGKTKQELTIAESLLIKEHKPKLNIQEDAFARVLAIF